MKSTLRAPYSVVVMAATLIVLVCSNNPTVPESAAATAQQDSTQYAPLTEGAPMESDDEGVAGLPFARGAVFHCLDDYLTHLKNQGAIDLPWWREVRPGVYERITTMTGGAPETATRAELMQRFGFRC